MKKFEKIGILACVLLAPGYVYLMYETKQPIEWEVVCFILAMGLFLLLYATVFRKFTENTQDNRDTAIKVIKKAVSRGIIDKDS